jgi:hypothetical protein
MNAATIPGTRTKVYHCEEHGFTTTDPRAAAKHTQGHLIDLSLALVGKAIKTQLGIPITEQPCRCGAFPYPHRHAPPARL